MVVLLPVEGWADQPNPNPNPMARGRAPSVVVKALGDEAAGVLFRPARIESFRLAGRRRPGVESEVRPTLDGSAILGKGRDLSRSQARRLLAVMSKSRNHRDRGLICKFDPEVGLRFRSAEKTALAKQGRIFFRGKIMVTGNTHYLVCATKHQRRSCV